MKEHPILMNAEAVKAILDGSKTRTYRPVTALNSTVNGSGFSSKSYAWSSLDFSKAVIRDKASIVIAMNAISGGEPEDVPEDIHIDTPRKDDDTWHRVRSKVKRGDRLWVRETFAVFLAHYNTGEHGDHYEEMSDRLPETEPYCEIVCKEITIIYRADTDEAEDPVDKWRASIHMPHWASRIILKVVDIVPKRLQDITGDDVRKDGFASLDEFELWWDKAYGDKNYEMVWEIDFERVEP